MSVTTSRQAKVHVHPALEDLYMMYNQKYCAKASSLLVEPGTKNSLLNVSWDKPFVSFVLLALIIYITYTYIRLY